ncbi:hypothetical protein QBC38DRAFT_267893 [Podospora fimiseda]|uniref:Uncharacterized protein n=1 Tax=Podospora fimiseda TaxID=252190 RepID=A0AAN7BL48_9PEZI|nr:hypothetical protein QBC38DRAFT_267893 [Podospora fimiseda]
MLMRWPTHLQVSGIDVSGFLEAETPTIASGDSEWPQQCLSIIQQITFYARAKNLNCNYQALVDGKSLFLAIFDHNNHEKMIGTLVPCDDNTTKARKITFGWVVEALQEWEEMMPAKGKKKIRYAAQPPKDAKKPNEKKTDKEVRRERIN